MYSKLNDEEEGIRVPVQFEVKKRWFSLESAHFIGGRSV